MQRFPRQGGLGVSADGVGGQLLLEPVVGVVGDVADAAAVDDGGLFAFGQEAWTEGGKVSWPTRKETIQTTGIVFVFVVIMALVLFAIDSSLAWLIKLVTGRTEG